MWEVIRANRIKSLFVAMMMGVLLVAVGYALGIIVHQDFALMGAAIAVALWLILWLLAYFSGGGIMLASSRAKKITHSDFPELFNIVEEMKIASGLSHMPAIYIMDDPNPNAFATGRSPEKSAIAVTTGMLQRLNRDELQGVIAHEMSHIINRDVLFMTTLGVMLGAIVILSDTFSRGRFWWFGSRRSSRGGGGGQLQIILLVISILLIILAPILAQVIYFAASRKREYLADACGAMLTRYPEALASALENISGRSQNITSANRVTAPMYIVNPFSARVNEKMMSIFATHPPIDKRVQVLRGMGKNCSFSKYQEQYITRVTGRQLFSAKSIQHNWFNNADPPVHSGAGARAFAGAPATSSAPAPAATAAPATTAPAAFVRTADAATKSIQNSAVKKKDINDFFWKNEGYAFIDCRCGVRLKVPPKRRARIVHCPKCMAKFNIPAAPKKK